jgi:hypothetical protein
MEMGTGIQRKVAKLGKQGVENRMTRICPQMTQIGGKQGAVGGVGEQQFVLVGRCSQLSW